MQKNIYDQKESERLRVKDRLIRFKENLRELQIPVLSKIDEVRLTKIAEEFIEVLYYNTENKKEIEERVMLFNNLEKGYECSELLKLNDYLYKKISKNREIRLAEQVKILKQNLNMTLIESRAFIRGEKGSYTLIEKIEDCKKGHFENLNTIKKISKANLILEIKAEESLFLDNILEIINCYVCTTSDDERIKEILSERNRKKNLEKIHDLIKNKNCCLNEKVEKNEKFISEISDKTLYLGLFDYFFHKEYFRKERLQKKVSMLILEEKIPKYADVSIAKMIEYLNAELGSEKTKWSLKALIAYFMDGKKARMDFLKQKKSKIEYLIEFLNGIFGRKLSSTNLKNLKAIYYELFESKLVLQNSRATAKTILNNRMSLNEKYVETITEIEEGKFPELKDTGSFQLTDKQTFESIKNLNIIESEEKKKLLPKNYQEEDMFLAEKITRGMFLAEGLTQEDYKKTREIMWDILAGYEIISKIPSLKNQLDILKGYIEEIYRKLEAISIEGKLNSIGNIHFEVIKNEIESLYRKQKAKG